MMPFSQSASQEIGAAIVGGGVVGMLIFAVQRRFERAERRLERTLAHSQSKAQYQLALGLESSLSERTLCRLDLSGLVLAYKDLRATNLFEADLRETDFFRADLRRAILVNSDLRGAHFDDADLSEASLSGAKVDGAVLTGTRLCSALITGVDLRSVELGQADISGIKWDPKGVAPMWPAGFSAPENAWIDESDWRGAGNKQGEYFRSAKVAAEHDPTGYLPQPDVDPS